MTSVWLLVIWLSIRDQLYFATSPLEFHDKSACELSATLFREHINMPDDSVIDVECFQHNLPDYTPQKGPTHG